RFRLACASSDKPSTLMLDAWMMWSLATDCMIVGLLDVAFSVCAKYTFQLALFVLPPLPSSLSSAVAPYQAMARLPGRSPVSIHGIMATPLGPMSLTNAGGAHVRP